MSKSMRAQDGKATEMLPAQYKITVTMDAVSTALIERYNGDTLIEKVPLVASEVRAFGEFVVDCSVHITCLTGSLTYDIAQSTARKASVGDAAAGEIGEYLESNVAVGSEVTLTTVTAKDVTTLALTEGDWDVTGVVDFDLTGVTATQYVAAIGATADTVPPQAGGSGIGADAVKINTATFGTTITGSHMVDIAPVRVKVPQAGLTIHLVADATFSAGTLKAYGTLRARRAKQL